MENSDYNFDRQRFACKDTCRNFFSQKVKYYMSEKSTRFFRETRNKVTVNKPLQKFRQFTPANVHEIVILLSTAVVGEGQENKSWRRPMKHRSICEEKKPHLSSRDEWYSRRTDLRTSLSRSFFFLLFDRITERIDKKKNPIDIQRNSVSVFEKRESLLDNLNLSNRHHLKHHSLSVVQQDFFHTFMVIKNQSIRGIITERINSCVITCFSSIA